MALRACNTEIILQFKFFILANLGLQGQTSLARSSRFALRVVALRLDTAIHYCPPVPVHEFRLDFHLLPLLVGGSFIPSFDSGVNVCSSTPLIR
jgi:hypothetical protein